MVSGIFQSSVPSRNNNKNSVSAPRVGYALCIFVWVWIFKALFRIFQKMRNLPKENCGMIWWVISMQKRFSVAGFFNHHVCPENCTRQDETCTQDGTARPYRMDGPQQARCRFLPSDGWCFFSCYWRIGSWITLFLHWRFAKCKCKRMSSCPLLPSLWYPCAPAKGFQHFTIRIQAGMLEHSAAVRWCLKLLCLVLAWEDQTFTFHALFVGNVELITCGIKHPKANWALKF